jgi:hypothetical protein
MMGVRARRSRSELTRLGRVEWTRRQYWSREGSSLVPVDALVDRVEATLSVGVRECCCRLGTSGCSFARAAEDLGFIGGVRLSAETLRTITEDEGRRVLRWCRDEQLLFDFDAPSETEGRIMPAQPSDPRQEALGVIDPVQGKVLRVYASMDGVQTPTITEGEKIKRRAAAKTRRAALPGRGRPLRPLPPRKRGTDQRWKETKIVTFYNQASSWRQVAATVGDHVAAGRLLAREGAKIGLGSVDQIIAPVDGAVYIRSQMQRRLPGGTQLVLDFFHLSGHVHEARRNIFGEVDPQGHTWVERQLHTLRHESPDRSWQSLLDWRGTLHGRHQREQADRLLGYVGERKPMLRYADCDEHGWDVGSGPMESMCKQIARRLKGRGMRWDRPNIQSMAALECLYQSGQSDIYWKCQLLNN